MEVQVNFPAVIAATMLNQVLGAIWYSPQVFGKRWLALTGQKAEDLHRGRIPAYLGSVIGAFIASYVLAHFAAYTHSVTPAEGAQLGFWLWLGLVATTSLTNYLFQGKPYGLYLIDNGYHLAALMAMGVILASWR